MKQTPSIAIRFISNYTKYAISMRTSSLLSRLKYDCETPIAKFHFLDSMENVGYLEIII